MSITSITKHKLDVHLKTTKNKAVLGCKKISGFGVITLTNGGAYRIRYTNAEGKRKVHHIGSTQVLTPQQAGQIAVNIKTDIAKGKYPDVVKAEIKIEAKAKTKLLKKTCGEYFHNIYKPYKDEYGVRGDETLANIEREFGHLFDRPISSLNINDVNAWYESKRPKGLARATLINYYGGFKAMLNHATTAYKSVKPYIDVNPLASVLLPDLTNVEADAEAERERKTEVKRVLFTDEDKQAIKRGLDLYKQTIIAQRRLSIRHGKKHLKPLDGMTYPHWFFAFCDIARLTGMRMGDIYHLKWENIETNLSGAKTLIFKPRKTKYKSGKQYKPSTTVKFPVHGELLKVFETYSSETSNSTGYLFLSPRTNRPLDRKAHLKHWAHVKKNGELREEIEFYSFVTIF